MGDVLVWWATAVPPHDPTMGLLNAAERTGVEALRQDADRAMFVSAHVLLRRLIAEEARVPVAAVDVVQRCDRCGQAHGQPRVVIAGTAGPAVSLAHADGVVVVARAADAVGVDLERTGRVQPDVAALILSAGEQEALAAVDPAGRPAAMTRTWVRKEALLKAAGTGLLSEPTDIVLTAASVGSGGSPITVEWSRPGPWSVADLDLAPGFEAAVALQAPRVPAVTIRRVALSDPG